MDKDEINIKSPEEITIEEKSFEEDNNTITTPAEPTSQDAVPETPPVPNTAASEPTQPEPVAPEPAQPESVLVASESLIEDSESKPSHKARNIFIVVLVLTLAALGTFTTFAIINHNNQKTEQESPNTPEKDQELDPSLKLSSNSLSDFDLEFLKLENESENKIYSPLSIKYALAMLKDGAAGDSKTQIENLIGNYTPKAYTNSENRSLANAIAINETYKNEILPSYINTIQTRYNAEAIYDPFMNALTVNQWVSDKTLGRIENLLEDDFNRDNDKVALLINALAIDMEWQNKIQCSDTVSNVECKKDNTVIRALHENHRPATVNVILNNKYGSGNFDSMTNAKIVEFGAGVNNYDIKTEIGEEKIIETIKSEYNKWLESEDVQECINENGCEHIERTADDFLKNSKYLEELYSNYGTIGSTTDFMLNDTEEAKVFAKDLKEYDGDTLQYVAIMPKEKNLETYIQSLTADKANALISGLKEIKSENFKKGVVTKITGSVPIFEFDYDLKLKEDLINLGVEGVFNENGGNLLDMTENKTMFVQDAIHKANIDFSNEGIKAAAVTVVSAGLGNTGGLKFEYLWDVPVEEIDLTFNKPFLFLIRDKASGEVWFTGTVYKPSTNE